MNFLNILFVALMATKSLAIQSITCVFETEAKSNTKTKD